MHPQTNRLFPLPYLTLSEEKDQENKILLSNLKPSGPLANWQAPPCPPLSSDSPILTLRGQPQGLFITVSEEKEAGNRKL